MKRNRSAVLLTAATATLVLLSGCSTSSSSSPAAGGSSSGSPSQSGASHSPPSAAKPVSSAPSRIEISNFSFQVPASVKAGATVTVTNADSVAHTVTASATGGFNVNVPANGKATFTAPRKAGRYPFICTIHSTMHATLVVK